MGKQGTILFLRCTLISSANIYTFFSECDFGTYGDMCNETCGKCRDQTKCHHSNGTCLFGCSAGYDGALCKTCMGAQYVLKQIPSLF